MFADAPIPSPRMTLKAAIAACGSDLGNVSKMPDPTRSYGYSVKVCGVGGYLRSVKGSVCEDCYADGEKRGGNYAYPSVVGSHANRLQAWIEDPQAWTDGMVRLLDARLRPDPEIARAIPGCERSFRWLDSGDILSLEWLSRVVEIAERLPDVAFWLPTKEYDTVRRYKALCGSFPRNLIVRVSAPMRDAEPPASVASLGQPVSMAYSPASGRPNCAAYADPDPRAKSNCGSCRICWTPGATPVYPVH